VDRPLAVQLEESLRDGGIVTLFLLTDPVVVLMLTRSGRALPVGRYRPPRDIGADVSSSSRRSGNLEIRAAVRSSTTVSRVRSRRQAPRVPAPAASAPRKAATVHARQSHHLEELERTQAKTASPWVAGSRAAPSAARRSASGPPRPRRAPTSQASASILSRPCDPVLQLDEILAACAITRLDLEVAAHDAMLVVRTRVRRRADA